MSRLLGALVTALLAWCGLVQPVQAAVSPPTTAAAAYAYDGHDTSALVLNDASKRGPTGPWSDSLRDQPVSAGFASVRTYDGRIHDANLAGLEAFVGAEVQGWNGQSLRAVDLSCPARLSGSGVAAETAGIPAGSTVDAATSGSRITSSIRGRYFQNGGVVAWHGFRRRRSPG